MPTHLSSYDRNKSPASSTSCRFRRANVSRGGTFTAGVSRPRSPGPTGATCGIRRWCRWLRRRCRCGRSGPPGQPGTRHRAGRRDPGRGAGARPGPANRSCSSDDWSADTTRRADRSVRQRTAVARTAFVSSVPFVSSAPLSAEGSHTRNHRADRTPASSVMGTPRSSPALDTEDVAVPHPGLDHVVQDVRRGRVDGQAEAAHRVPVGAGAALGVGVVHAQPSFRRRTGVVAGASPLPPGGAARAQQGQRGAGGQGGGPLAGALPGGGEAVRLSGGPDAVQQALRRVRRALGVGGQEAVGGQGAPELRHHDVRSERRPALGVLLDRGDPGGEGGPGKGEEPPVNTWWMITPRAHTSAEGRTCTPRSSSGARQRSGGR